jgi:RimJ/RimL family protein N-acetyltransferase
MTTSIRRATTADVPAITQIRNDAHAKKIAHRDHAWGKEGDGFSETWVLNSLSRREVYVVEQDGTLVGTFSFSLGNDEHWEPQEPIAGYVHGLCVRKGFNGRGLGSFMLDWCTQKARGLNLRCVRLDCAAHNAELCAYYESLGFSHAGFHRAANAGGDVWALYEKSAD